uniref:1,4-dihydroxy-2-naphthoyl-CoA hydrolase n=1 Tax=Paulinella chromatophora TaxID=39717 RepID=B1X4A6_PAUCH|nr:hypothetical protein PCC_0334 [Paulinella chromatophora]ACB42775.1 hypothetical protein PCC_0334 [Paulinella chromatophora]
MNIISHDKVEDCLKVNRIVRFGDTDAAGVMHFQRLIGWCHEAYEESLERFGIPSKLIFPTSIRSSLINVGLDAYPTILLPIIHCSADYIMPVVCGDSLLINLTPKALDLESFEIKYTFDCKNLHVAYGRTRHLAIRSSDRQRCLLPELINDWLKISNSK